MPATTDEPATRVSASSVTAAVAPRRHPAGTITDRTVRNGHPRPIGRAERR